MQFNQKYYVLLFSLQNEPTFKVCDIPILEYNFGIQVESKAVEQKKLEKNQEIKKFSIKNYE